MTMRARLSNEGEVISGAGGVIEHEMPTHVEAVAELDELFGDFPYEFLNDYAAVYAALVTPCLRMAIDGPVPLVYFGVDSPATGKTLLPDLVRAIHGCRASVSIAGRRAGYTRKKLYQAYRLMDPIHTIYASPSRRAVDIDVILDVISRYPCVDLSERRDGSQGTIRNDTMLTIAGDTPDIYDIFETRQLDGKAIRCVVEYDVTRYNDCGFTRDEVMMRLNHAEDNRDRLYLCALSVARQCLYAQKETTFRLPGFERWVEVVVYGLAAQGIDLCSMEV
jgi:hypothetical protein